MKRKTIFALVLILCTLTLIAGSAAAWFAAMYNFGIGGNVTDGYFAGGDGSADKPFVITNEYHMYNLAWLHYYGYFPKGTFTYFKVQASATDDSPATIHMDRLTDENGRQIALPPIGTGEEKAFCGQFNGNKSTISNLLVSVYAADVNAEASSGATYDFGANLGMFGTALAPTSANADPTRIFDFNLDNVVVEIKTFEGETIPTVGLVAGRADTSVIFERVGVIKGKITAEAGNKINSKCALIGSIGDGAGGGSGDEGGNDLIIDPNLETNGFVGLNGENFGDNLIIENGGGGYIAEVTGAKRGYAYYTSGGNPNFSQMSFIKGGNWFHPYNGSTSTYLDLNTNLYTFADYTPTPSQTNYANKQFVKKYPNGNASLGEEDSRIYQMLNDSIVAKFGQNGNVGLQNQKILFSIDNGLRNDNLIQVDNGVYIPKGGVYFKPMLSGKVSALVYVPNPSNFCVGLFKLRRPTATATDGTQAVDFTAVSGIERISEFMINSGAVGLVTAPNAGLGYDDALSTDFNVFQNKIANPPSGNFYFLFEYDVNVGEEYMLGVSKYNETFQTTFVYLILPKVNQQGGSGGLTGMDFVTASTPMWAPGYVYSGNNVAVSFELSGTAGTDGFSAWFKRDAAQNPQTLYFTSGSGITAAPDDTERSQFSSQAQYGNVRAVASSKSPPGQIATADAETNFRRRYGNRNNLKTGKVKK